MESFVPAFNKRLTHSLEFWTLRVETLNEQWDKDHAYSNTCYDRC